MFKDIFDLEFCTISHHNPIHIHEDVLNFDAAFERTVKKYISRSINKKGTGKAHV